MGTDGMVSGEVRFSAKIGMVWGQMGWSGDIWDGLGTDGTVGGRMGWPRRLIILSQRRESTYHEGERNCKKGFSRRELSL